MAPTELFIGPNLRRWRERAVVGLVLAAVNPTALVHAQEEQPGAIEPTVGEAVAVERAPSQQEPEQPDQPAQDRAASDPAAPPLQPASDQVPSTATSAISAGRSMMGAVRAAAARQLVPMASVEDLRQRTLDTSFPAEQPQLDIPEPPREVVAPPLEPALPREPSRRTVVRVIDGVTVLTNVTDGTNDENAAYASAATPRAPGASAMNEPAARAALVDIPREVIINSNALSPASKSESTGLSPWLWVLAGLAGLLLVPIGVLLTRPVRRS